MTTYAIIEDVRTRLGRPIASTAETDQITVLLADVLDQLRNGFAARGFNLDAQVAANDPTLDTVKRIQAWAVVRKVIGFNPTGLTSVTKSIDDGSITERREGKDTTLLGPFTDEDWAELLPTATVKAFSIRPHYEPDCNRGSGWY